MTFSKDRRAGQSGQDDAPSPKPEAKKSRGWVAGVLVVSAVLVGPDYTPASAQEIATDDVAATTQDPGAPTLSLPSPAWYTDEVHRKVLAAGPRGVEVPLSHEDALLPLDCAGYSPPSATPPSLLAVSAGGCMVHPSGCTMNFIFSDGASKYIGTAGHCVDKGGDVVMQVGTRVDVTDTVLVTVAKIGRVAKRVDQGIGRDFGLVKIDPGWAVVPGIAGALGPTGAFCGDPLGQPVLHYGHGYVFLVSQGDPKVGEVIPDLHPTIKFTSTSAGYNWVGYGLPGDSGSAVTGAAGLAVGNLTHGLGVAFVPIPGLSFGTTMSGMFDIIGPGYALVTVDGRAVKCNGVLGL